MSIFKSKKAEVKSSKPIVKLSVKELMNVVGGIDGGTTSAGFAIKEQGTK